MNLTHKKRFPRICKAILLFAALSGILYVALRLSVPFADWFNQNISTWGRRGLAYLTAWFSYHLQGNAEAGSFFTGSDPELKRNSRWQDVTIDLPDKKK